MRNVLELWEDHAQYGDLSLYCVSPQPMDIAGEKSIVLIVKVEMQEPQEPGARCVTGFWKEQCQIQGFDHNTMLPFCLHIPSCMISSTN